MYGTGLVINVLPYRTSWKNNAGQVLPEHKKDNKEKSAVDDTEFAQAIAALPIHQHMGGKIEEYDPEQQTMTVTYQPRPEFANGIGLLQGGILTAMLDDGMGIFAWRALGSTNCVTVTLNMNFLRPANLGEVTVKSNFVKEGKRILNVEGCAYQDGKMVAKATAVFMQV